jgi:hypothetical protein
MHEQEIRKIALFFFFATLDAKRALDFAVSAFSILHKGSLKPGFSKILRGRPNYNSEAGWILPTGVDLAAWTTFQKGASDEELLATIWSQILNISDHEIAKGLQVSVGTVRFRVAKGLRSLGAANSSASSPQGVIKL